MPPSSSASLNSVATTPWPLPMPPATMLSSLFGSDALVRRAAADPQMQSAVNEPIAVQMHAIGAHAEKRHRAAVEPE